MVCRRAEWVSKLLSVGMFCCDSRVCTVIKWCSSEADVNICLSDENPVCISTTRSVTGWSNGMASLDQSIAHVAFELWNDLYFRIKVTPRNFRGSFILNNWKFPITLHFHHAISYRLEQWCGEFGSKYRACSFLTLKCFKLSYKSNAAKLSWFVYFEQLKTFQ